MITTETVLVLGAGASSDFGFPLGIDLLYEICGISEGLGRWRQICEAGHDPEDLSLDQSLCAGHLGMTACCARLECRIDSGSGHHHVAEFLLERDELCVFSGIFLTAPRDRYVPVVPDNDGSNYRGWLPGLCAAVLRSFDRLSNILAVLIVHVELTSLAAQRPR